MNTIVPPWFLHYMSIYWSFFLFQRSSHVVWWYHLYFSRFISCGKYTKCSSDVGIPSSVSNYNLQITDIVTLYPVSTALTVYCLLCQCEITSLYLWFTTYCSIKCFFHAKFSVSIWHNEYKEIQYYITCTNQKRSISRNACVACET